jgi:hypothetical protein
MPNIKMQELSRPGSAWTGYNPAMMQYSPYEAQQRQMMNQVGQMGLQGLLSGKMPGGSSFEPIKQAYEQNYRQNVMPSIAERFASLGGQGAAGSSGFKASMLGAENQLQTQLAGMQSQYQAQMLPLLMRMLGIGLQPQNEYQYLPGKSGIWENLGSQAAHGFGEALPSMFAGDWVGALANGVKGLFSKGADTQEQLPQYSAYQPQYIGGGVPYRLPSSLLQGYQQ